jgi:Flp pilus assembly pilin Flp
MSKALKLAKAFWNDEQGATFVEYILIVAAIALPLLGLLIIFREELWDLVARQWDDVQDSVP